MTSRESDSFRVGLIGYGLAGASFHAPFIVTTPGLRLAAIVTKDPERRRQASRDHPDAKLLETADALWTRSSDLDLVVVASPNRTHVPFARAAVDTGLAVVVDKPLAANAAEARSLIAHARARGTLLTVFQNRRWDGDFLTLRRLLDEGAVGQPFRFESRFERWRPELKPGWRHLSSPEDAGGLLYDFGSHVIDQALQLFGPVVHVRAELDRRHAETPVDDDSFVALTHASGVRSHLFMSSMSANAGPRFRVLGSKAAYVKFGMDPQEDALRAGRRPDEPGWGEEPPDRWGRLGTDDDTCVVRTEPGAYQMFYRGVAAALRGEGPVPVDPEQAAAALDVIELAQRYAPSTSR